MMKTTTQPKQRSYTRQLLSQTVPLQISQWAGVALSVMDTMMLGHYSADALQVISISGSIFITVTLSVTGVIRALIPIMSHNIGAQKDTSVGELYGQGYWLSIILTIISIGILLFPEPWLALSGEIRPAIKQEVYSYLHISMLAVLPFLMYCVIISICTAGQKARQITWISLLTLVIKLLFNYLLIFGKLGLPAMGSDGAAIATVIACWVTLLAGLLVVHLDKFYRRFKLRLGMPRWHYQREILKLGIPMGGSYLVEICAFTLMTLFAAREGVFASGAHMIMSNLMALLYSTPLSLGIASVSLTAQQLGMGNPVNAHGVVRRTWRLGLILAIINIAIIYFLKMPIIHAYTSSPEVIAMAAGLLAFVPFFHMLDTYQCLNVFILRGHKIALPPLLLQIVVMLAGGLGGGYYFGYGGGRGVFEWLTSFLMPGVPIGVATLWLFAALGLLPSSVILYALYRYINHVKIKEFLGTKQHAAEK